MPFHKKSKIISITFSIFSLCYVPVTVGDSEAANVEANAVQSNGKTALMLAARDGNMEEVKRLLKNGADVNRANKNGGTPIMYATLGGNLNIVKILIELGADPNAAAENGWTALMISAAKGYSAITKQLLDSAADPNLQDIYHWSPLMRAVYEGRDEVAMLLLTDPRTNVNHRGENGVTALHIATVQSDSNLVVLLLEHGADKTIADHSGRTPYEIARQMDHSKLLNLLQLNKNQAIR